MTDDTTSPTHRAALERHAAGDLAEAATLLQAAWTEARDLAPENAAAIACDLAVVLFQAGRPDVAQSFVRAEIDRDGTPRLHDALGQLLLASGQAAEASAAWERCLALGYDTPQVRDGLVRAAAQAANDASPQRAELTLVVPVANDVTCDRGTLESLLAGSADGARIIAVPWADPLSRRLRAAGHRVLGPRGQDLVGHYASVGPLPDRFAFLEARLEEDEFLRRLHLPGRPRIPTTSAIWDRWLFQIQPLDVRRHVERLPLDAVSRVEVIGGSAIQSPFPGLVVAAARARGLPVVGRVVGPVNGRWAPLWLHGCTRLVVGSDEQRRELALLGTDVPVDVDPALDPVRSRRPILWDGPPQDVLVDVHRLSERGTLEHHLAQLVRTRPGAIRRFVIKGVRELCEILARVPGKEVAGVPIVVSPGSPLRAALSGRFAVVSVAPYRLLHHAAIPDELQCGVIHGEVLASQGAVPASFDCLVADRIAEGVA